MKFPRRIRYVVGHHRKLPGHHPRRQVFYSVTHDGAQKKSGQKGSCEASSQQYRPTRPGSEVKCLLLLLPTSPQPPSMLYTTSMCNKILSVRKHSADSLLSPHVHGTRGPPLCPYGHPWSLPGALPSFTWFSLVPWAPTIVSPTLTLSLASPNIVPSPLQESINSYGP